MLWRRIKCRFASSLVTLYMRLVFSTSRLLFSGKNRLDEVMQNGPVIFALWHGQFFPYIAYAAKYCKGLNVLTSLSEDGEVLSQVIRNFKSNVVRGDERLRGAAGLVGMIKRAKAGEHTLFAVDGPLGPRHKLKPGVIRAAQKSGALVVPVACAAKRFHLFGESWDQFFAPFPFGRMSVVFGEPFYIKHDVVPEDMTAELTHVLEILSEEARLLAQEGS